MGDGSGGPGVTVEFIAHRASPILASFDNGLAVTFRSLRDGHQRRNRDRSPRTQRRQCFQQSLRRKFRSTIDRKTYSRMVSHVCSPLRIEITLAEQVTHKTPSDPAICQCHPALTNSCRQSENPGSEGDLYPGLNTKPACTISPDSTASTCYESDKYAPNNQPEVPGEHGYHALGQTLRVNLAYGTRPLAATAESHAMHFW